MPNDVTDCGKRYTEFQEKVKALMSKLGSPIPLVFKVSSETDWKLSGEFKDGCAEFAINLHSTTEDRIEWLASMAVILFLFNFYKIGKHNPEDFLDENETDFAQTLALLMT